MRKKVAGAGMLLGAAALLIGAAARPALAQQKDDQGQNQAAPGALAIGGSDAIDPNQPIKVGFTLGVRVESAAGPEPDLTGSFQVDPSGSIQMKLAGSILVRGLTPLQAADKIAVALKPYIKDPKVQVSILAVPKPVVTLGGLAGSVLRPGATVVNDTTTLAELLTVVGTGENADLTRVRISRRTDQGVTTKEYNLLKWLKPSQGQPPDESQNPVLQDRDLVYVPPKTIAAAGNVTVTGAVARPGLVPTRSEGVPMTLREAISQAGGPTTTADRRQVSIRRAGVDRPIVVNYDKMEADDPQNNIVVQPDDIVYVETLARNQYITLGQAFNRPGKIPYDQPILLSQAVAEAGGPTPGAKTKEGRILRYPVPGDPTKVQVFAFDWKKLRNNKQSDYLLEPGDIIDVEQGTPPRPALSPLELTQSLLSIALIVDRLFSGNNRYGY